MSQNALAKRQFGHRARLALSPAEVLKTDDQAHAARTLWNCLHAWWQMMPKEKRTLGHADAAIRQARQDIDFLAVLPAQAAQAVLKTYFRAWKNCWDGRADAPNFKDRFRSVMSVDVPQGRDLNITRVHRRWGQVNIPKVGRVRFRWTKDLPVGKHADTENRITGARLIKNALGWHITFRVQTLENKPEPHQGPDVGIDVGITVPIALSDGETYEHGEWLTAKEKARLLHLEQNAAKRKRHRKPGERTSRRLHHTYDRIAGLRAKAKRRALDWQHKTTTIMDDVRAASRGGWAVGAAVLAAFALLWLDLAAVRAGLPGGRFVGAVGILALLGLLVAVVRAAAGWQPGRLLAIAPGRGRPEHGPRPGGLPAAGLRDGRGRGLRRLRAAAGGSRPGGGRRRRDRCRGTPARSLSTCGPTRPPNRGPGREEGRGSDRARQGQ